MFRSLYIWEIKKMTSLRSLIILAAVAILSLIFIGVSFNTDHEKQMTNEQEQHESQLNFDVNKGLKLSKSEAALALKDAETQLNNYIEKKDTAKDGNDMVYMSRANVTFIKYIIDNELYDEYIMPNLGFTAQIMSSTSNKSTQGFMAVYLSIMSIAILMYGIVCGSNAYGKEIKTGTLKMVMIRPISRNKLTFCKLLAALTVSSGFFLGAVLVAYIFGSIAYGSYDMQYVYVFNARYAFMTSSNLNIILIILSLMIQICSYVTLAMAISTITKSNVLGITIPSIIAFNITYMILSLVGIGRFLFSYNAAKIANYFWIDNLLGSSDFYINIIVLAAYLTIFVLSTFMIFSKRDIA